MALFIPMKRFFQSQLLDVMLEDLVRHTDSKAGYVLR